MYKLCRISQKGKSSFAAAIEQDLILMFCDKSSPLENNHTKGQLGEVMEM